MNPRVFLAVLLHRWKAALLVFLLTVAAGAVITSYLPKRYVAEAAVMVDIRSPDPIAALLSPTGMYPGTMGTQVDIIKSDRVARKVVRILRLNENATVRQMWLSATEGRGRLEDWITELLQRGLKVTPSRDSNILTISYQGADPAFVAAVANAYAEAYIEASVELKVEPARQYAQWFGDQAKVLRENLEKAQSRLSEFQQKKGIVVTDEAMDHEVARLNELSARLIAVQQETRDARSKQRAEGGSSATLPEVMSNAVVQTLRTQIAQLEAKLSEAATNLGTKHPQYLRMESELAELKNRLAAETSHVASGYSTSTAVGRNREAELRAAIEAQRKKVLDMKTERDQLAVLMRDVETAKRAYEAVTTRFTQTSLESQATRTNVSVLTPAVEPLEPSFPKPLRTMLLLAVAAGLLLAGAAVAGLEMLDRRVRSPQDLAEMLQLPVLAVIEARPRFGRLWMSRPAAALPLK
jgi:chain length determinant protein EpsF